MSCPSHSIHTHLGALSATHRTIPRSALALVVALLLSATAQAQLFRAYLAPTGSDSNACTLPAPCRLLPAALAAVADGGEIWMLDSANYNSGPVNIAKSVTILAVPGVVGSVVATGGNAIDIATAGVEVALRNLVIVPFPGGGGTSGINMTASVRVTDTTIRDNAGIGIWLRDGARATITRATISGNSLYGVYVLGTALNATTTADIGDSTLDGNNAGVYVWSQVASTVVRVSVRDSRVLRSTSFGMFAFVNAGAAVSLSASNNIVSNNDAGIGILGAGSKAWASGNTVSDNTTGLVNDSGLFESAGNNAVRNNATGDTNGTITVIATK